jgi:hypothetical protein
MLLMAFAMASFSSGECEVYLCKLHLSLLPTENKKGFKIG